MKKLMFIAAVAATVCGCRSFKGDCDDCSDCTFVGAANRSDASFVTYGEYKTLAKRVEDLEAKNDARVRRIAEMREARRLAAKNPNAAEPKKPFKVDPKAKARVEKAAKGAK